MNRAQRRSAKKVKQRVGGLLPDSYQPIKASHKQHFMLGLVCLLRSPIESLKAIGMLADMQSRSK
jgi:hypothetical protein